VIFVVGLLGPTGCAPLSSGSLGPGDVPDLRAQVARAPDDAHSRLRLAAALAGADRCDEALEVASQGAAMDPADPLAPLVIGECLETAGRNDAALTLYGTFLASHGSVRGASAVEGRRALVVRRLATEEARLALQREDAIGVADPEAVGVFPFVVDGPARYQPLSAGLAHMLTTDLALIGRFPLVERVRLDALLAEIRLSDGSVDPATAARAGRLTGASRVIVGTLAIPEGDALRLGSSIVVADGRTVDGAVTDGRLDRLLSIEKDYALGIAEQLGYVLSEAERQRVLDRRPANLAAFLAFSRGLLAESRGDYGVAAGHYGQAARSDPAFADAMTALRRSAGAEVVSAGGPGAAAAAVEEVERSIARRRGPDASAGALRGSVLDIASHQTERATADVGWANTIIDTLPVDADLLPALRALLIIVITIPP
jgi:tetratricopeptide (TPR) repeat protein